MIDAVIFDIDGTLVDSVDLHAECWHEAFLHFGKNVPFAEIRAQIGKGGDQLLPVFLSREENERFGDDLEKHRSDLWKWKYLKQVKPFPKVRELFRTILAHDQQIALASSAKKDELEEYKRIANIADLVEGETSADDVERSKPHPDVFEAALATLEGRVDRGRVMVVGDSPWDVIAASRAGLACVGVLCGGFPRDTLLAAGAIEVFDGPEHLLERYLGSPIAYSADVPEHAQGLPPALHEPQLPIVRSTEHPPEEAPKTDPSGPF